MGRFFKRNSLKTNVFVALFVLTVLFSSCISVNNTLPIEHGKITEFERYGHAKLDITIEKMLSDGYELGDTVDIYFDNGRVYRDVPFFNGYYVKKGDIMLRAYPGHTNVAVCINYGKINEEASLDVGDTVLIVLSKKKGAIDTQELNSLVYSNERSDFESDAEFANFREITTSGIGQGILYRSASPINNENKRASTADQLISSVGIKSVINLADSNSDIESYIKASDFNSPYYKSLYDKGNVIALSMPVDFSSPNFQGDLVSGIKKLVTNEMDTPILIHCTEGKDRAGFTSALLEAFMGASADEIIADYMVSYKNYYGITEESDSARYDMIVKNNIAEMLKVISGKNSIDELTPEDLMFGAINYLIKGGMTEREVEALIRILY